jgi:hypothetical protein
VVDASNDRPVRDAEVMVLYSWGEIVEAGLTDSNGRVYLRVGQPGGYLLAVERLGYPAMDTLQVHLLPDQTITVQVRLEPEAIELEGLSVIAERIDWNLEMAGFYNRQRASSGYFREIPTAEARRTSRTADYFREASGVFINSEGVPLVTRAQSLSIRMFDSPSLNTTGGTTPQGTGTQSTGELGLSQTSFSRSDDLTVCPALLIVDGIVAGSTQDLEVMVPQADVSAVEVHRHPSSVPPQWRVDRGSGGSAACGVFVVWTRRGGSLNR